MKRSLAMLLGLVLIASLIAAVVGRTTSGEPVYPVAQVQAGLARYPRTWVGRTILVRGRLTVQGCGKRCLGGSAILADPVRAGQYLRVTWTAVNPLLALLLDVPIAGTAIRQRIGGDGVYRIRLVRRIFASSPRTLPQYFPYTKRLVSVTDDSALLVDGLQ